MAGDFEYRQAREIGEAFARRGVRYLFLGKSGAILLGFPDTTQDADVFVERSPENCRALASALADLGFPLTDGEEAEILRGKDFVQIRTGPFDLDLVFAPDGIETFADADRRAVEVEGLRVCHLDDIIRSKAPEGPREPPEAARLSRMAGGAWEVVAVARRRRRPPSSSHEPLERLVLRQAC